MKLHFSKASLQDIPAIIAIAEKIWLPSFARYFEEYELNSLFSGMYTPQKLLETLNNPAYAFYFVKDEKGSTLGYFAIEMKSQTLKLDKIYVDPTIQRQGLGKIIFQHITELAEQKKAETIALNVNRRNSLAISFYKKLGFEIIRNEDIPGPNGFIYDDYVMELRW